MILPSVLTVLMLATLTIGLALHRRSPAVALAFIVASLGGVWFSWMPEDLTHLANRLGVGRGTDLALYLGLSFCVLALAAMALQLRHLQNRFTRLVRTIALAEAEAEAVEATRGHETVAGDVQGDALVR